MSDAKEISTPSHTPAAGPPGEPSGAVAPPAAGAILSRKSPFRHDETPRFSGAVEEWLYPSGARELRLRLDPHSSPVRLDRDWVHPGMLPLVHPWSTLRIGRYEELYWDELHFRFCPGG